MGASAGALGADWGGLPAGADGRPLPSGICERPALRRRSGTWSMVVDAVAEEVPVALQYNGVSHAVMLATPRDLEDFAVGFTLTEAIAGSVGEIHDLDIRECRSGLTVEMTIASSRFVALKQRRRQLTGRTGCGLCGVESLDLALPSLSPLPHPSASTLLTTQALLAAVRALRLHQPLHDESGATHAAGFADGSGRLLLVREDVGRHNALDKLVGAMARAGIRDRCGVAVVSSRASHEMVLKTVRADIPVLAAVSGVTQLAIRTAEEAGLCLAGFVRGTDLSLYAHGHRVIDPGEHAGSLDESAASGWEPR